MHEGRVTSTLSRCMPWPITFLAPFSKLVEMRCFLDLQTEEGALSQLTQQLGTNTTQGNSSVTCNIHKQQDHLFRCMLTCSIPPSTAVPCMLATATHAASYVA